MFFSDHFSVYIFPGCSGVYNNSLYPEMDELNTQVAEQTNSALQRIKSALSYMNQTNFMRHCQFYLWYTFIDCESVKSFVKNVIDLTLSIIRILLQQLKKN